MNNLELIRKTLELVLAIHDTPSAGSRYCPPGTEGVEAAMRTEKVELAPATLEQVRNAIKACEDCLTMEAGESPIPVSVSYPVFCDETDTEGRVIIKLTDEGVIADLFIEDDLHCQTWGATAQEFAEDFCH